MVIPVAAAGASSSVSAARSIFWRPMTRLCMAAGPTRGAGVGSDSGGRRIGIRAVARVFAVDPTPCCNG